MRFELLFDAERYWVLGEAWWSWCALALAPHSLWKIELRGRLEAEAAADRVDLGGARAGADLGAGFGRAVFLVWIPAEAFALAVLSHRWRVDFGVCGDCFAVG